nr:transporter substrate-binding domain-containing protein [Streptomyces sp. SID12488]
MTGVVHIGAKYEQPGFGMHDGESHTDAGFDTDLANYLGAKIGFTPKFEDVPSGKRVSALTDKTHWDVKLDIETFSITEDHKKHIDFVGPYLLTYQGFLVLKEDQSIKTKADFSSDMTICTVEGSTSDMPLPGGAHLDTRSDYKACIEELKDGNAAAVFTDLSILYGYAQVDKQLKVVPNLTYGRRQRYGIGLAKGHIEDCKKLLRALRDYMKEDWAKDFKTELPAIVEAYPDDWETQFRPDPSDLNQWSSCQA